MMTKLNILQSDIGELRIFIRIYQTESRKLKTIWNTDKVEIQTIIKTFRSEIKHLMKNTNILQSDIGQLRTIINRPGVDGAVL